MTQDFGTVRTPDVHLNGTDGTVLAEGYERAARSLNDALDAICEAAPNARDYAGSNGFPLAQRQHEERVGKLRAILAELREIHESVVDQVDERAARKAARP